MQDQGVKYAIGIVMCIGHLLNQHSKNKLKKTP